MAGWSAGSGSCWCGRLVWCAEQGTLRTTGQTENKTKQNFDGNGQMSRTQERVTGNYKNVTYDTVWKGIMWRAALACR